MKKTFFTTIFCCILIATIAIVPCHAIAEDVQEMTADELEAYISQLQDILQNKRKEESNTSDASINLVHIEAFRACAKSQSFDLSNKSIKALEELSGYFTGTQQTATPNNKYITSKFDLNQFKKRPDNYGDKLIYISNAKVFQVLTMNVGDKTVEKILMETSDDTIYYGYYYGESNIVEDMKIAGYILPLDWSTYKNVNNNDIWAVFCAISDIVNESYETLRRGDNNEDVWHMKLRMQELGYFTANAALSFSYNGTCEERVRQFQKVNGLRVTGIADHETLKLLFSDEALRKP